MLSSIKNDAEHTHDINPFLHILTPDNMECAICGCSIESNGSFRFDDYGNTVCATHTGTPKCAMCRRFIKGPKINVPYFGYVCTECGTSKSYAEALEAGNFVSRFYAKKRLYIPGYQLHLLSPEEMAEKYSDKFLRVPLGIARNDDGGTYHIDIMRCQSKVSLASTLAHESLHLWQFNRKIVAPKAYREGFCNLGSFLVVATIDKAEALVLLSRMMENPDPEYGVAFRRLKILHDVYGWRAVVKSMKQFTI